MTWYSGLTDKLNMLSGMAFTVCKRFVNILQVVTDTITGSEPMYVVGNYLVDALEHVSVVFDSIVYTILTQLYIRFIYYASMLFSDPRLAFKDTFYDFSRLVFRIDTTYDSSMITSGCIYVFNKSCIMDYYIPFMALPNSNFKLYADTDAYIPSEFLLRNEDELREAIYDGYSIAIFDEDLTPSVSEILRQSAFSIQPIVVSNTKKWFVLRDTLYVQPRTTPLAVTILPKQTSITDPEPEENDTEKVKNTLLSDSSKEMMRNALEFDVDEPTKYNPAFLQLFFIFMFPFTRVWGLVAQYVTIRNLKYNQTCYINPESTVFLASLFYWIK